MGARKQNVRRLVSLFETASVRNTRDGAAWYREERNRLERLADRSDVEAVRVIAAFAALSPRLGIAQNRDAVEAAVFGYDKPPGVLSRSWKAARAILKGAPLAAHLRGPKVRAFFANLYAPEASLDVTVDTHATAAWAGSADAVPDLRAPGVYEKVAEDYRAAAAAVGVLPHVLQATVWLEWRERQGWEARYGR